MFSGGNRYLTLGANGLIHWLKKMNFIFQLNFAACTIQELLDFLLDCLIPREIT